MREPEAALADPARDEVMGAIGAAYGIAITAPPARLGGAVNRVFRVATDRRSVVVRVHRDRVTPVRLAAVHGVQARLREAGLPVPRVLTARDGASWIEVDGCTVEVLADLGMGHEIDTWADAAATFGALGRFHGATRAIDVRSLPPPVNPCYAEPDEALALLARGEAGFGAHAGEPGFGEAAAARANASVLAQRLRASRHSYEGMLPETVIHGDFVGRNVPLAEGRVIAILDFDRLAVRERVWDVAYTLMAALSRLLPDWRAGRGGGLGNEDLAAVATLLAGYDAASGWPLTAAERRALPFEMARTPLYPIATAGDEAGAVGDTLLCAPHLPVATWLVDNAGEVAAAFEGGKR